MGASEHCTYIEKSAADGRYYWWCSADEDCDAGERFAGEQEAYDSGRLHEDMANGG